MSKPLKIGVMGCANIAKRSLIPALIENKNFELVAVASRSKEKADEFAALFNIKGVVSYESLLEEDIDAVYVPLPTGLHEEWVIKCIERGKHVLVEKSFGMDLVSTVRILDLALSRKIVAMENFMFPYHNQHEAVMSMLNDGRIGKIRNFKANFSFPPLADDNFRYNSEVGGGAILDAAAYTVKAAQVFLGKELTFLSATMHFDSERNVDILGSAHFVFDQRIPIHLSWGFDNFYQCGVEILGTKGKLTTNRTYTAPPGFEPSAIVETHGKVEEVKFPADDHFQKLLNEFYRTVEAGEYKNAAEEVKQQSFFLGEIQSKAKKYIYEK